MIKIKSKNQNYVPNTIFFLQSWIQIRIKVPTSILKKVTKTKTENEDTYQTGPRFLGNVFSFLEWLGRHKCVVKKWFIVHRWLLLNIFLKKSTIALASTNSKVLLIGVLLNHNPLSKKLNIKISSIHFTSQWSIQLQSYQHAKLILLWSVTYVLHKDRKSVV